MSAEADAVWNRATTERPLTAPGDRALQGILVLHGQIRNGAELLTNAYSVAFPNGPIAGELREQYTMGLPDPIVEEIEASDERYSTLFPDDGTLAALFERRFAERPGEFAPLES